jgi:hypothetical protein
MITQALMDHFATPVSIAVGTVTDGRPVFLRAFGLDARLGAGELTIYVPVVTAGPTLAGLEHAKQASVSVVNVENFQGFQLKGEVTSVAPAGPEAEATIDRIQTRMVESTAKMISPAFSQGWGRFVTRPAVALTLRVREIFQQTPGAGAGERIA